MDPKLKAILRREQRLKLATVIIILVTGGTILFAVDNMLLSVVLAVVLKYLMAPVVDFLERRRSRWAAGATSPSRTRQSSPRFRAPVSSREAAKMASRLLRASSRLSSSRCDSLLVSLQRLYQQPLGRLAEGASSQCKCMLQS